MIFAAIKPFSNNAMLDTEGRFVEQHGSIPYRASKVWFSSEVNAVVLGGKQTFAAVGSDGCYAQEAAFAKWSERPRVAFGPPFDAVAHL